MSSWIRFPLDVEPLEDEEYGEDAAGGIELFDTKHDPQQFENLAKAPEHAARVARFQQQMAEKLQTVRDHDLAGS